MKTTFYSLLKMREETGILLLSLLAVLKTVNSEDLRTVYSSTATPKDANSLLPITWQEALPLIIFQTNDRYFFRYPVGLKIAQIKDGRLAKGTEFTKPTESHPEFKRAVSQTLPQIHLCPNPTTKDDCLVPTQFGYSQILQCEREPIPIIEENPAKPKCGFLRSGKMLQLVYKICRLKEPYRFVSRSIVNYSLCYDKPANRILFAGYNLSSLQLLSEKLLKRERGIKSEPSKDIYKLIDPKYYTFLDDTARIKSRYKFQKLVPTDNMALAAWRKTTYKYINMALQHEALIELWDDINLKIRTDAIKCIDTPRRITTGVFDIPNDKLPENMDNNQIYNIWITTVVTMNPNRLYGKIKLNFFKGIAILMHNFISKDDTRTIISKQLYIDELCEKNLCAGTLMGYFATVRGEVRCCKLTEQIYEIFWGKGEAAPTYDMLRIPDITN